MEKHGSVKIASFKCCVNGLPEFSQLLLYFFNIDSINLVLYSFEFISGLLGPQL